MFLFQLSQPRLSFNPFEVRSKPPPVLFSYKSPVLCFNPFEVRSKLNRIIPTKNGIKMFQSLRGTIQTSNVRSSAWPSNSGFNPFEVRSKRRRFATRRHPQSSFNPFEVRSKRNTTNILIGNATTVSIPSRYDPNGGDGSYLLHLPLVSIPSRYDPNKPSSKIISR